MGRRRSAKPVGRDPASLPPSPSSLWNLPNALTMMRLVLVPVFGWLLLADGGDNDAYRMWATVVFIVASVTDFLDGYIARKRNLITTFGKVADPIADKALTGCALIGLSYLGELPWWVTVVILLREVMVTCLRFWVIKHGVISASRGGKAKTVSQMIAIVLFVWPGVADPVKWTAMGVAVALTIITGLDYIHKARQVRDMGELRAEAGLPGTAMTIEVPGFTLELASRLLFRLGQRQCTVATAESLTGGLVAGAITAVPGSSAWFRGGVVAYATEVKASVLGVDGGLLEHNGPVSPITAGAMARAVRELFRADLGIATTGVAGPDPLDGVPPGVMYVATSFGDAEPAVRRLACLGDRSSLRGTCVIEALDQALQALEKAPGERE